jgi:DNA mismatch endonuclease, patch repair protein
MERVLRQRLRNGAFSAVSPTRSRNMSAIRGAGNLSTEQRLRMCLVRAGIGDWVVRPDNLPGKPDFFFATASLAIFVDGCFWHGCPDCGRIPKTRRSFWALKLERNQARDKRTTASLRAQHVSVLRIWECQLRDDRRGTMRRITQALARCANHLSRADRLRRQPDARARS